MSSLEVDKSLQWALHKRNANGQKTGTECVQYHQPLKKYKPALVRMAFRLNKEFFYIVC